MLILLLIAMSDFILQTTVVAVLPNQASRQVTFTFHVDSIAQELDETVRLRLTVSQSVLNRFDVQFDNSVFFLDTTDLVIVDSDSKCHLWGIIRPGSCQYIQITSSSCALSP